MSNTTTSTRKPTKRDRFNALLAIPAVAADEALVEFIKHEIELLDRKNAAEPKLTKAQVAAASLREAILAEMEPGTLYTVSEAMKALPSFASDPDMSNQKASRVLNDLVKEGAVVKTTEKRKSYFSVVAD